MGSDPRRQNSVSWTLAFVSPETLLCLEVPRQTLFCLEVSRQTLSETLSEKYLQDTSDSVAKSVSKSVSKVSQKYLKSVSETKKYLPRDLETQKCHMRHKG